MLIADIIVYLTLKLNAGQLYDIISVSLDMFLCIVRALQELRSGLKIVCDEDHYSASRDLPRNAKQ